MEKESGKRKLKNQQEKRGQGEFILNKARRTRTIILSLSKRQIAVGRNSYAESGYD